MLIMADFISFEGCEQKNTQRQRQCKWIKIKWQEKWKWKWKLKCNAVSLCTAPRTFARQLSDSYTFMGNAVYA